MQNSASSLAASVLSSLSHGSNFANPDFLRNRLAHLGKRQPAKIQLKATLALAALAAVATASPLAAVTAVTADAATICPKDLKGVCCIQFLDVKSQTVFKLPGMLEISAQFLEGKAGVECKSFLAPSALSQTVDADECQVPR